MDKIRTLTHKDSKSPKTWIGCQLQTIFADRQDFQVLELSAQLAHRRPRVEQVLAEVQVLNKVQLN
jgi:hypothetical protein